MPGAGSMDHMVKTIKNNAKLLRRKGMFKKERSFLQSKKEDFATEAGGIPTEDISAESLNMIRNRIVSARKKRNLKLGLFIAVTFPLLLLIGFYFLQGFSFGFDTLENTGPDQRNIAAEKSDITEEKYLYYLNDGDTWLQKKSYYNAIFQYKKAVELFPSEFAAHYRMAVAYSYQCQYEFKGCEEGMKIIERLEKEFPNSEELPAVRAVFEHWGASS